MKKIILLACVCLFAVSVFSQKKAVVYNINISIKPELRFGEEINTNDRNFLTGVKSREEFTDSLVDTLLVYTENYLKTELGMDVNCVYRFSKKGKRIVTMGVADDLEKLPAATFKKTVSEQEADYYINITGELTAGGMSYHIGDEKHSKLKPQITLKVTVFDADKEVFWKGKTKVKDLGKLKGKTKYKQNRLGTNYEVTKRETLSPEDILWIYLTALEQMMNEVE